MSRISPLAPSQADSEIQATLDAVKSKLGMVPNLISTFARAPAALHAYLGFSDTLAKGQLSQKQREIIALAVGQTNSCQYCLSAHTAIAKGAGLSEQGITDARSGMADTNLDTALAKLAISIVQQKGQLIDGDVAQARENGITDSLLIEVIANVALNIFMNYTNHIAGTEIDFPVVDIQ